uniref:Uncharacterized protein n=2 Tax=Physcomitrium patens TaxID=3218 RepID=A9T0E0_PHYPA|nr:uncharacterized protein LOC112287455 [Physcomitrium patens]PNR46804.1 hypothetical protein PHYPA_013924 [Physcomitrium patens]|eukprot:XP_024386205.1 uncharacterized protein LOC112287455 [Physcomitrella patens]
MALGQAGTFALVVAFPGVIAFILGIVAENSKPTGDLAVKLVSASGQTTCLYPKDPTPALGTLAAILLFISATIAVVSLVYPYEGKRISIKNLAKSVGLVTFVVLSLTLFLVAESLLLWATVLESVHRSHNHHSAIPGFCPTAKAGLFGGAAFMALDSTLFWLICLMLVVNARADHFGYEEEDVKGTYEGVTSADYVPPISTHITPKV